MQKILNYILNGSGLGMKFLGIFSLIVAIVLAIFLRISGAALIPYAQSVANQLLPIKIENGVITEPVDTIKTTRLQLGSETLSLPLVLDTTTDTLDTQQLKPGVYITRTQVYTINDNQVKITKFNNSVEIPQGDYRDVFKSWLNWAIIGAAVLGIGFIFTAYFLLALFYAGCAFVLMKIMSRALTFEQRMRLSVLSIIVVYAVISAWNWIGVSTNWVAFLVVMLGLQAAVIGMMPKNEAEQIEGKKE